ncbi:DUF2798 domain-containing protein [Natronospirillum operosum]|uniref:DUF2798 domain-containing protein n=1 Tax=Natronospirillum operosum TaxID=2759953 RepID=A0A4Z0W9S4_9GAMM|nr:DUF2798 domain-containing protein [Natronospirillum operosum]TGG89997.1 DUF2798 domain-containing protein [Natronospirillum operosum]
MLIPPRYARLLSSFLMSIYMVTLMTFVITLVNTGLDSEFPARWWRAFYIAWPIAFILILTGVPVVQKLTSRLVRPG